MSFANLCYLTSLIVFHPAHDFVCGSAVVLSLDFGDGISESGKLVPI